MSADSPRRSSGSGSRGMVAIPAIVPPQVVSDRSILDSAIGFINDVTLAHQPPIDPKDTITWARFETDADISDPRFGEDWELEGNVAPPLLLILGYGLGVQVWAIPANGEAVEVLSWRHGIVSALRVLPTPVSIVGGEENGRADEPIDAFAEKRPLVALVDGSLTSGSQPQFCAVNFISLKTGAQVKTIKFKNPVIDILANRSSVVITFHERIAVFDARTLEDRLSITTCYPSPGINPNPVALGPRWLAYAENKLLHSKRSGGGCDGEGVASYTATVLNASKSLVKGLRELGEQVAAGLTGTSGSVGGSKNTSFDSGCGLDTKQSGIVTIIDVKQPARDCSPISSAATSSNQSAGSDTIIAHFVAHSEALVAMEFDNSGMLLVTADRRGHDFHVFRIQANPVGSSLAAVHHLYILHRGDTSAKVQNITLTLDSRWVAVSTLRGTTHVFPITPYGGTMGVRTHTSLHVVNKLSRFHRSAGLSAEGRSNSPISHSESTTFTQSLQPYHNSTLPPFPRPTVVMPLAQLRQPFVLGSPPGSASLPGVKSATGSSGSGSQRQRLSSLSDDSGKPLSVCAIFAKSRSWLLDPPNVTREAPHRIQRKAVDSLFVMAGHGALIQYDLDTKLSSNVAKEKICDDTPIELEVEAKAQWNLGRRKEGSQEIMPPLSSDNWLIKHRNSCILTDSTRQYDDSDDRTESWLSQVEIITHAGPHRRLWMGPQFVFKTYNTPSGSNLSHVDIEAVEIGTSKSSTSTATEKLDHSSPLNMPLTAAGRSSAVPVLIESGSYSSIEQSPKLMDRFRHDHLDSDFSVSHGDSRLKQDLADAMRESPSATASTKDSGGHGHGCEITGSSDNVAFYDALTAEDDQVYVNARSASAAALASVLPNIHSYDNSSSYDSLESLKKPKAASIEKIVNPLGTVTTVTSCLTTDVKTDILDEVVSQLAAEDTVIHENCDESLFRPVVAIFCDENTLRRNEEEARKNSEQYQPPENISSKLVVPVIAKEVNDELSKREKEKTGFSKSKAMSTAASKIKKDQNKDQFEELSSLNRKSKEKEPKSLKPNTSKGDTCLVVQNDTRNYQKTKSPILTDTKNKKEEVECSTTENVCVKNKIDKEVCTKVTVCASDTTKSQLKPKEEKEMRVLDDLKDKPLEEENETSSKNIVKVTQKMDSKTIIKQKSLEDSEIKNKTKNSEKIYIPEENKKIDSDAKTSALKVKTKTSASQDQVKEEKIETSKNLKDQVSIKKACADLQLTATLPSKTKELRSDNESTESKSNDSVDSKAATILIKTNTAIKEKAKKSKDKDTTSSKTEAKDVQHLAESLVVIKDQEIQVEEDNRKSNKKTETKADDDKPIKVKCVINEKSNSKLNEKIEVDLSKINYDHEETSELKLSPSIMESQQELCQTKKSVHKENDNTVELENNETSKAKAFKDPDNIKTNEKLKGKDDRSKNEENTKQDILVSKEFKMPIAKNTTPDVNKSDSDSKKQSKEKSRTSKLSDDKVNIKTEDRTEVLSQRDDKKETFKETDKDEKIKTQSKKEKSTEVEKKLKETEEKTEIKPSKVKTVEMEEIIKEENETSKNLKSSKDFKLTEVSKSKDSKVKSNISVTQDAKNENKDYLKKENVRNEIKSIVSSPGSTKIMENVVTKDEHKKDDLGTIKKEKIEKKDSSTKENSDKKDKKDDLGTINKEKIEKTDSTKEDKKDVTKNDNKSKSNQNEKGLPEGNLVVCAKPSKPITKIQSTPPPPPTSAWKTLSGAEMIGKNLAKSDMSESIKFPPLGAMGKLNVIDKLLPELPTPIEMSEPKSLDDFSILKPLEQLPPLPALEPLQLMSETGNKNSTLRDISLINFESPLQENPALQRKITPAPRGFTEQNLILALCGSLHYENEHVLASSEKSELSPTFSSNHSSTAFEEPSLADYKSLTENDDTYMSLEQSSQDTNTTTTNTTNEKFSSSTNSSGSEEIIIMEEKKMTKKQKRKKQQQLKELQKQKEQQQHQEIDDEELRPLIAMTESQIDQTTASVADDISTTCDKNQSSATQPLIHSTTTDSEGPMPATTSDDNVCSISVPVVHNPHKIKTKKLEHKINLIAAIEAATSSSTSSAEESGVEVGGRSSHDNDESLISVSSSVSALAIPLTIAATPQSAFGALKKKTKRRKR